VPIFTCITEIRQSTHLSQHVAVAPSQALREHVAALPYDDGTGPFDDELEWLQNVAGGISEVTMHPVSHCRNTWLWLEGARYDPQYLTYMVQTDV
jgi:hypothetical protein